MHNVMFNLIITFIYINLNHFYKCTLSLNYCLSVVIFVSYMQKPHTNNSFMQTFLAYIQHHVHVCMWQQLINKQSDACI